MVSGTNVREIGPETSAWSRRGFSPSSLFAAGEVGAVWLPGPGTCLTATSWNPVTGFAGLAPAQAGDPVVVCKDLSGNNHPLSQTNLSKCPTLEYIGGIHCLEGDGVDDWMSATMSIAGPWDRLTVLEQLSWTFGNRVWGDTGAARGYLFQEALTPQLTVYGNTAGPISGAAALNTRAIVAERQDDDNSSISINGETPVTGDAGPLASIDGVVLFSDAEGDQNGHARFFGAFHRQGTLTAPQLAEVTTWLRGATGL